MYTYRIVLDAFDSRHNVRGARVMTYSQGFNRWDAYRRIGSIRISSAGTVSDGIHAWPGWNNMPRGNATTERGLPEWTVVSVRSVPKSGTPRIIAE